MLRGNNKYYFLLLLLFIVLVLVEYYAPKPLDWRRTYSKNDKIPFGCNAFFRLLDEDVYKGKLEKQRQTPFNVLLKEPEKKSAYLFINSNLHFSKLDARYLMQFAEAGNDVFFAANNFWGNPVADSLNISSDYYYYFPLPADSAKSHSFNFCSKALQSKKDYTYKKGFFSTFFRSFDTARVEVLATSDDTNAVFLRAPWGKGNFYFLSAPDIFTNYFIVNNPNREFAYKALSYLHADQIWWDEYYKDFNAKNGSPLQFIFGNDSLYAGYLLALISLIVFMIFALKRRQRSIAIVRPLENTTLQFVEVVGSVYYNSRNHRIIAEEKINAFYEFLRTRFSVAGRKNDTETLQRISRLSTIPIEDVNRLFRQMSYISSQSTVTEEDLVALNTSIENFHKHNKR
jgi:hypothetical protein